MNVVSEAPSRYITDLVSDAIAPGYWVPNSEIKVRILIYIDLSVHFKNTWRANLYRLRCLNTKDNDEIDFIKCEAESFC